MFIKLNENEFPDERVNSKRSLISDHAISSSQSISYVRGKHRQKFTFIHDCNYASARHV